METQSRIYAIAELRRIDSRLDVFGANLHRYACHMVSEEEIRRFESTLGVTLPPEYRTHLLEIGYGAGPYYGLFSLQQVCEEFDAKDPEYIEDFGYAPNPQHDFPFTQKDANRIRQSAAKGQYPYAEATYPSHGAIPIVHQGCTSWNMLITSGELRGTVWDVTCAGGYEGLWTPPYRPPAVVDRYEKLPLNLPTFNEWFDSWLAMAFLDLTGSARLPQRSLADPADISSAEKVLRPSSGVQWLRQTWCRLRKAVLRQNLIS